MGIAFLMGRVVRRLTSPVRTPRGQPVPVPRTEPTAFEQRFPRVPPTFMTASEHAYWLKCEAARVAPAPWMADTSATREAWSGMACSRPEMSAQMAEQARAAQRRMVTFQEEQTRRAAEGRPCEVGAPWSDYCLEHNERLAKCHQKGRLTDERYAALLADYRDSLRGRP